MVTWFVLAVLIGFVLGEVFHKIGNFYKDRYVDTDESPSLITVLWGLVFATTVWFLIGAGALSVYHIITNGMD